MHRDSWGEILWDQGKFPSEAGAPSLKDQRKTIPACHNNVFASLCVVTGRIRHIQTELGLARLKFDAVGVIGTSIV